jgi:hypothetical protein
MTNFLAALVLVVGLVLLVIGLRGTYSGVAARLGLGGIAHTTVSYNPNVLTFSGGPAGPTPGTVTSVLQHGGVS